MTEPSIDLPKAMVRKVLGNQRKIREEIREIKMRLGRLETEVAGR